MNKIFKNLIYSVILALTFFGFSGNVLAVPVQVAHFQTTPLFSQINFAPGSVVSRSVIFSNLTPDSHSAFVKAKDVLNQSQPNLGDAVELTIKDGDTVLYDDTFTNFFSMSEVVLPQVPSHSSMTIDFVVTFKLESGNEYQKSTMSFTLEAGLEDVAVVDDNTIAIGGEQGSGGGGGGNGPIIIGKENLIISDEAVAGQNPPQADKIVVTWNTNIPASSQVIYGPVSGGPYNLDLTKTNFGYPSMTTEDPTHITSHSVSLSGIVPEQLYSYRVVSRASPPTVGYEHTFVLGTDGVVRVNPPTVVLAQNNEETGGSNGVGSPTGTGVGAGQNTTGANEFSVGTGTSTSSTTPASVSTNDNSDQTATAFLGMKSFSWKIGLSATAILVLLIFVLFFWRRKRQNSVQS